MPSLPVGIDTIRIRGRVDADALTSLPVQRTRRELSPLGVIDETPTSSEVPLGDGVKLYVDDRRRTSTPNAHIEASIPRLLRGDNRLAATVEEVRAGVRELHRLAGQHVRWAVDVEDVDIVRLDLARDFDDVDAIPQLLRELSLLPPNRARTRLHLTDDCRGVQSLYRETERWEAKLYARRESYIARSRTTNPAKRAAFRQLAASEDGRLRYELELKSPAVSRNGLRRIGLLSDTHLAAVARSYFDRCRFGDRVGTSAGHGRQAALQRLHESGRHNKLPAVLGQVYIDALGLDQAASRNTRAEYRRIAKHIGLTVQDLTGDGGQLRRLDFDLGLLLVGDVALEVAA